MSRTLQSAVLALLLLVHSSSFAARSEMLPPVGQKQDSEIRSLDEAIEVMYVSDDSVASGDVTQEFRGKLQFTKDLALVEIQAIEALITDTSVPNSEKQIRLARYTTGDDRMSKVLIKAFKAGINVQVVTDFNPIMEAQFAKNEKLTADFQRMQLKDPTHNEGAQFIKDLLDAGFEVNKNLFSQPLYNEQVIEQTPIMHEKALLLKAGAQMKTIFSTANLARNMRYNRLFVADDPLIYKGYAQHLDALVETYKAGKETHEIPVLKRTLIAYQDGSSFEMAFTDGKYNPNDRIVERLSDPSLTLISGTFSHFVMTNGKVMGSLEEALKRNRDAKIFMIGDDRFAATNGWGLLPVVEGLTVYRPAGREVRGFRGAQQHQVTSFIYQRGAVDPETGVLRVEQSEDGPPTARHVWHDKTTSLIFKKADGQEVKVVFTGSFNLSTNSTNSEFQAEMRLGSSSWIGEAIDYSVQEVVKRSPLYAIPTVTATIRNVLGFVYGLTDLEVPLALAEQLHEAALERDVQTLNRIFDDIAKIKTNLKTPTSPQVVHQRLEEMKKLINWFFTDVKRTPRKGIAELRFKQFLNLALVIADQNLNDYQKKQALQMALWNPEDPTDPQAEKELIEAGLKILDGGGSMNRCLESLQPAS